MLLFINRLQVPAGDIASCVRRSYLVLRGRHAGLKVAIRLRWSATILQLLHAPGPSALYVSRGNIGIWFCLERSQIGFYTFEPVYFVTVVTLTIVGPSDSISSI